MNKKFKPTDILIGILFTICFLSFGVIFTVNFRPLFYYDMQYLDLSENTGYSDQVIFENYNALIDYNSPFNTNEFHLPSMPSSASGTKHFEEVKMIFQILYVAFFLSLILLLVMIHYKRKREDHSYLLVSAITAFAFPSILSIFILLNFSKLFLLFHKVVFRNDDWLFDPATDPIINILPETFFLHCAVLIIACLLIGSFSLLYIALTKRNKSSH